MGQKRTRLTQLGLQESLIGAQVLDLLKRRRKSGLQVYSFMGVSRVYLRLYVNGLTRFNLRIDPEQLDRLDFIAAVGLPSG